MSKKKRKAIREAEKEKILFKIPERQKEKITVSSESGKKEESRLGMILIITLVAAILIVAGILIYIFLSKPTNERFLDTDVNIKQALIKNELTANVDLSNNLNLTSITQLTIVFFNASNSYGYNTAIIKNNYQINSSEIGLENFKDITKVRADIQYKPQPVPSINGSENNTNLTNPPPATGGGSPSPSPSPTPSPCVPNKTCTYYYNLGQCGASLSDGCSNSLTCNSCSNGTCSNNTCVQLPECTSDTDCGNLTGACGTGTCNLTSGSCYVNYLAGSTCRNSTNECDAVETCISGILSCPADINKTDGEICSLGTCQSGSCTPLSNPVFYSNILSPVDYGDDSSYSASETNGNDGGCSYILTRNGDQIATGSSVSDSEALAAGTYDYNYSTSGCMNYTAGSDTRTLEVYKATPTGAISGTGSFNYGTQTNVLGTAINSNDSSCNYELFRDGISVLNPDIQTLTIGNYNYNFNTSGCMNYSAWNLDSKTLIINEVPECYDDNGCNQLDSDCAYGLCVSGKCTIVYNSSSTVCRASIGECDAEEKCTSTSASCPADVNKTDGETCSSGTCQSGTCKLACTNELGCDSVGSFCDGNIPYTCSAGADGCLDRINGDACGIGYNCIAGSCAQSLGNIYYVSNSGNDANNGKTEATAWKTLAKVNLMPFLPGDTILFKRGDVWREQLTISRSGVAGKPITFGTYGSGANPAFIRSDPIPDSAWTLYSGSGGIKIWKADYTAVAKSRGILENGNRKANFYMETSPEATLIYDESCSAANSGSIMYYRKDSGAPTNTEIGARQSGIYIENVNNIIVDGIDVSGPGASSGFDDWSCVNFKTTLTQPAISILGNSRDIVIKNLMVSKAEGTGVSSMIDSDSITIENVSVTKCGGNGIWIRSANSLIKNCKAYENGREPGDTGDRVGIGIGNCGGTSILVEGNEVYKNGQDDANNDFEISAYGTFGPVYIRNNYVHDCGAGCIQIATSGSPTDASNSEITFNIIDGYGTTTFSGEDPTTGKYSGIRIGDSAGDPDDKVMNVKIYNNIISGGGAAAAAHEGAGIAITKEGTNGAMIKNNIFYNNLGAEIMLIYTSGYNISYNLYSNASTWNLDYARKTSFSAWKSTTGQDANSIIGDPLFVNYAGKNFHLQYSSPAIDKGTNVGFSLDRDGTQMPQGVGYDIGAYEYVAGVIPESAPNSIFSQIINWVKEFVKNPWTK